MINVRNTLENEAVSIHFHGLYQRGTPWMDGVSMITQCAILPNSNFTYRFIADVRGPTLRSSWFRCALVTMSDVD